MIIVRNRLKYALNYREVMFIVKDKAGNIKIDNKTRRDPHYPVGFNDVVSIEKTGDFFRLLYDMKGRFVLHKIDHNEAKFKLCKVIRRGIGANSIPYILTNDGRTIRFPHPDIKANDTIKVCKYFLCIISLIWRKIRSRDQLSLRLETWLWQLVETTSEDTVQY